MTRAKKKLPRHRRINAKRSSKIEHPRAIASVCIIWRTSERREIALIKRRDDHPHHLSGQWFFPGGGVGYNEDPANAAERETQEECGVAVQSTTLLDTYALMEYWSHQGTSHSQPILLIVYEAVHESGKLRAVEECTDARWIPIESIHQYIEKTTSASHLSAKVRTVLGLAA